MKTTQSERGSALVITLLLLILLTAIGIFAVSISTTELDLSLRSKTGAIVFNAAESGVYAGFDRIGPTLSGTTFADNASLPSNSQYWFSGSLQTLRLAPGYGGNQRMAVYQIDSTGRANAFTVQRQIQATVEYGPMPIGTMY